MLEEFEGGVTENIRGKWQRQTAVSGGRTLDLLMRSVIEVHIERPPTLTCDAEAIAFGI